MINAHINAPVPVNEPVLAYAPGSPEREELKAQLQACAGEQIEIPLVIGGRHVRTGDTAQAVMPHNHQHVLATFHKGNADTVAQAVAAAEAARPDWAALPWEARAAVFLRAAELLAGKYRQVVNAATMLNQSKSVLQAEIDAACELIDFFRYNVSYMPQIFAEQPGNGPAMWNYVEYRPLEGFVLAVTPFNFTSIAGNLPTAPAMMGNTVIWKPASTAVLSAWRLMELLQEAGLPDGVINFVPGSGGTIGEPAMNHPSLGGVHFTGSTEVFQGMWRTVGANIANYRSYPRIVGETGGKDFIFAHPSADPAALATGLIRGAYEYSGQKCSAASRAYIPKSIWDRHGDDWCHEIDGIRYGDVADLTNFMGSVIDAASFRAQKTAIDEARAASDADVVCGGACDDTTGYYVAPTLIRAHDPHYRTMEVELFGPVLTVYVYDDDRYAETLELCDRTSPYALTGAIFATGPPGDRSGAPYAGERGRELLHQRQADGRGRGGGSSRSAERGPPGRMTRRAAPST